MESRRTAVGTATTALVVVLLIVGTIALFTIEPGLQGSSTNSSSASGSPSTASNALATSTTLEDQSSFESGPIQVLHATVARVNPQTSLSLNLNLMANGNESIKLTAYDVNTLDMANNITDALNWPISITSFSNFCGTEPVNYVVYRGDYNAANYTQGTPLILSFVNEFCTTSAISNFIFNPMSSEATLYTPNPVHELTPSSVNATISATLSGYWVGNSTFPQGGLFPFPSGIYTVAAMDQWGNVVTSQFKLSATCCGVADTTSQIDTTLTQTKLACENGSTACIELDGWTPIYANSTLILNLASLGGLGPLELNITFSGLPNNSGFRGSANLDQVQFPPSPYIQYVNSPVLPNLKQNDEVMVTITGTSGLIFTATFTT